MILRARQFTPAFPVRILLMGIVNVTGFLSMEEGF
jgi:hypothetical protein